MATAGRVRPATYAIFFAAFAAVVSLTHLRLLDLPYYWDELGQFIPAALDLYRDGALVPHSTIPNVHPPGLMAYLAAVWLVTGHSIMATRLAMLAVASVAVLIAFLLSIELSKNARGAPAFGAAVLLMASPLFFMQSELAQLDLPAMLFASWALLLFLQDRYRTAALASAGLVLIKETGLVVPLVFGIWLLAERKRRDALWFALPVAALAAWVIVLWRATGHPLGNREFTEYNLFFPLHPVRLLAAVLRRVLYLGFENFHFIGWIFVILAWRHSNVFETRAWRIATAVGLAQIAAVTVLGGAVLERYLLPVLPILYAAFAVAFASTRAAWARAAQFALIAGLLASLFWDPRRSAPFDNNLQMVDFVRLQQAAAEHVERFYPDKTITTAWPLSAALRRPDYGYVTRKLKVQPIASFGPTDVSAVAPGSVEVFILYSRDVERPWDIRRIRVIRGLLHRIYGYEPQVSGAGVERRFGLREVAKWSRGVQWIAVYARSRNAGRAEHVARDRDRKIQPHAEQAEPGRDLHPRELPHGALRWWGGLQPRGTSVPQSRSRAQARRRLKPAPQGPAPM